MAEQPELVHVLQKKRNLMRTINYSRSKTRPKNPTTLDFDMDITLMPSDLLKNDIRVGNKRHLLFMTETMNTLLQSIGMVRLKLSKNPSIKCSLFMYNYNYN